MGTGKTSIQTDLDGLYNTIPVKGFLDLRRQNFGNFGQVACQRETERKELMAAAKAGNEWAKERLRRDYRLTLWVREGHRII